MFAEFTCTHLLQLDNVGMVELLEGLDLAQVHHFVPTVVPPLHRLDGHLLARLREGHVDEAVGAVPDQAQDLVALQS